MGLSALYTCSWVPPRCSADKTLILPMAVLYSLTHSVTCWPKICRAIYQKNHKNCPKYIDLSFWLVRTGFSIFPYFLFSKYQKHSNLMSLPISAWLLMWRKAKLTQPTYWCCVTQYSLTHIRGLCGTCDLGFECIFVVRMLQVVNRKYSLESIVYQEVEYLYNFGCEYNYVDGSRIYFGQEDWDMLSAIFMKLSPWLSHHLLIPIKYVLQEQSMH